MPICHDMMIGVSELLLAMQALLANIKSNYSALHCRINFLYGFKLFHMQSTCLGLSTDRRKRHYGGIGIAAHQSPLRCTAGAAGHLMLQGVIFACYTEFKIPECRPVGATILPRCSPPRGRCRFNLMSLPSARRQLTSRGYPAPHQDLQTPTA